MLIVGIDPGVSGAIAAVTPNGALQWVLDMPVRDAGKKGRNAGEIDAGGLARFLRVQLADIDEVWVEDVQPMPSFQGKDWQQGKKGHGTLGAFSLGDSRGAIRGVLECLGLGVMRVRPQAWKRMYGLDADKAKALACVKRLYPGSVFFDRKKDHGRAESVLIARYGAMMRRAHENFIGNEVRETAGDRRVGSTADPGREREANLALPL